MNANFLKIRLHAAVGIYLSDTHVTSQVIEKGLLRAHHHEAVREPTSKSDWAIALHKVLEPLAESLGANAAVVIGLPANHAFFATLPTGNKPEPAETLLSSHHCCTSIPPSELSADMLPVKVAGRTFAAVGASRKKDLTVLTDVPRKLGFRFVRVEPGPWALLRACAAMPANKIALRLLVDDTHMLAVLATGQQPLLWRAMELHDDSADLLVSLVRTFETYASQHLGVPGGVDVIALEGPKTSDLADRLRSDLGPKFTVVAGPGPTPEATAKGLALGGMDRDKPAPDLARPLAPPPQLWDLVPRGEVALLGAVVVCMGLWLWGSGTVAHNNASRVEEDNAKNPILRISDDKLKDEKKVLAAEVASVNTFLTNRVPWTEYLNQLSHRVPAGIKFVSLQGEYELTTGAEKSGASRLKKGLLMNFSTMVPRNLSAPPEVDVLMDGIRTAPAIMRDFPEVKLSSLRIAKSMDHNAAVLADPGSFTVVCNPKGKDAAKPGNGPKPATGAGGAVAKSE